MWGGQLAIHGDGSPKKCFSSGSRWRKCRELSGEISLSLNGQELGKEWMLQEAETGIAGASRNSHSAFNGGCNALEGKDKKHDVRHTEILVSVESTNI